MVKREIEMLNVEELTVDKCNIRGGAWDYDEELIRSVKERDIVLPLVVRPISSASKAKFGIVCGSRRFNAACSAGLDKVPCIIEEMSDVEAMGRSLEENVMRKDIPDWQNIEWIGAMYEVLLKDSLERKSDLKFKKMDARYDEIVRRTGLNKNKVTDYVKIALYLPEEVRALLRPREDRTLYQEERLKGILYRTQSPAGTLTVYKAKLILDELKDLPIEKQAEVAANILGKTKYVAEEVVNLVKKHSDKDLYEIEQIMKKEPKIFSRSISFNKEVFEALGKATLSKQKELPDLVKEIVEEWLKKNLYLKHIS